MKIFRVVVRGQFEDLSEEQKVALRAVQSEHDFLLAAFTAEGSFTYDKQLVAFNLRYEVRQSDEASDGFTPEELEGLVGDAAVERAAAWLDRNGHPHKRLRATVTDMAATWK